MRNFRDKLVLYWIKTSLFPQIHILRQCSTHLCRIPLVLGTLETKVPPMPSLHALFVLINLDKTGHLFSKFWPFCIITWNLGWLNFGQSILLTMTSVYSWKHGLFQGSGISGCIKVPFVFIFIDKIQYYKYIKLKVINICAINCLFKAEQIIIFESN